MSGYDARLLASAPAATRAEKQEGYDIDLLDNPRAAPSHTPPPAVPILTANHSKAEEGGYAYAPSRPPLPWYRTRKWMFALALGTVVVLAAIIGGAVGGTVGHSSKNDKAAASASASDAGGGGAVGPSVSQVQGPPEQTATMTGGTGGNLASEVASAASAAATATSSPGQGAGGGNPQDS
ncbi:hypothetical protein C8Q77DRAFT_1119551 [Trametes polyzona]|nr:hypothetical protein C8Q77DRAFT_1119551 [Trametes polyzona]